MGVDGGGRERNGGRKEGEVKRERDGGDSVCIDRRDGMEGRSEVDDEDARI